MFSDVNHINHYLRKPISEAFENFDTGDDSSCGILRSSWWDVEDRIWASMKTAHNFKKKLSDCLWELLSNDFQTYTAFEITKDPELKIEELTPKGFMTDKELVGMISKWTSDKYFYLFQSIIGVPYDKVATYNWRNFFNEASYSVTYLSENHFSVETVFDGQGEFSDLISFKKYYYEAVVNKEVSEVFPFTDLEMEGWIRGDQYKGWDLGTLTNRYLRISSSLWIPRLALMQSFLRRKELEQVRYLKVKLSQFINRVIFLL